MLLGTKISKDPKPWVGVLIGLALGGAVLLAYVFLK
jgi:hypothetical protein